MRRGSTRRTQVDELPVMPGGSSCMTVFSAMELTSRVRSAVDSMLLQSVSTIVSN